MVGLAILHHHVRVSIQKTRPWRSVRDREWVTMKVIIPRGKYRLNACW
jgi:hypothetical protein